MRIKLTDNYSLEQQTDYLMSTDQITYSFCVNTLRYIHQILGDEAFMEEVAFVRRNKQIPLAAAPVVDAPVVAAPAAPVNEQVAVSEPSTTKQIVIPSDDTKEKYSRTVPSDELRCTAIVRSGERCKFIKVKNTEFCSRHPSS